jgi:hypothetical protein
MEMNGCARMQQTLELIVTRLERFPVERFVRMEAELQQLRSMLEQECVNRKNLAEEMHRMAREFQENVDKKVDRAIGDCCEDRDLRLEHLGERIDSIRLQSHQERALGVKMKMALVSGACALIVSVLNAVIGIISHK